MTAKLPKDTASLTLFGVLAARGLTAGAVARAAGISERLLRACGNNGGAGLNKRNLHKVICAIERLSGSPAPPGLSAPSAPKNSQTNLTSPPSPDTAENGGAHGSFILTRNDIDLVRCPPRLSAARGTYVLFIEGDSMLPRYEPGELIYVSPHRPARKGNDVLIVVRDGHGEQTAYIKRLLKRCGKEVIAEQFNPPRKIRFPTASIEAIHLVLRTVDIYGY